VRVGSPAEARRVPRPGPRGARSCSRRARP